MAALGNDASILLRIKGDSSEGQEAVKRFREELKQLEKASQDQLGPMQTLAALSGASADQFTNLKSQATAALGVVTAITAAVAVTGVALFKLAKNTADFSGAIFDATEKTGLGAERISALKYAADQSGSSLEQVTAGLSRFAKTIGEAAGGSDEAGAKIDRLKVTSYDLDEALKQALATIVKMKPGTEQMNAAIDAFGRSGTELLPFIKSFDGDLDELTKKVKSLGGTISDEAAREADAFGDVLDDLSVQAAGLGRDIGGELIPYITDLAQELSDLIKENQADLATWKDETGTKFQGVLGYWDDLIAKLREYNKEFEKNTGTPLKASDFGGPLALPEDQQKRISDRLGGLLTNRGQQRIEDNADLTAGDSIFKFKSIKELAADAATADEAEKAQKEREALAKRDAAAVLKLGANTIDVLNDQFQKGYDRLLDGLSSGQSTEAFKASVQELISWYNEAFLKASGNLDKLELAAAKKGGATTNEVKLLQDEQLQRQVDMADRIAKIREASEKAEVKTVKETTKKVEDAAKKTEAVAKQSAASELAIFRAKSETQIAVKEQELHLGLLAEKNYAQQVGQIRLEILEKERALTTDIEKQKILDEQISQQKIKNSIAVSEAIDKETEAQTRLNEKKQEALERFEREIIAEANRKDNEARDDAENEHAGTFRGQLGDALGIEIPLYDPAIIDQVEANAEHMKAVYADLSSSAAQSLGVMADGLANLLTQWIVTGKFSAHAALQMAAGVAIGLAIQAGMKALFNVAEGLAAAANPFTAWMAPGYFAAAKAYAVVAAIAGGAGIALGVAARATAPKQGATSAFAGQTADTGSGARRSTDGQGQAWSSNKPGTINTDANRSGGIFEAFKSEIELTIAVPEEFAVRASLNNIRGNGELRTTIRNVANEG